MKKLFLALVMLLINTSLCLAFNPNSSRYVELQDDGREVTYLDKDSIKRDYVRARYSHSGHDATRFTVVVYNPRRQEATYKQAVIDLKCGAYAYNSYKIYDSRNRIIKEKTTGAYDDLFAILEGSVEQKMRRYINVHKGYVADNSKEAYRKEQLKKQQEREKERERLQKQREKERQQRERERHQRNRRW